MSLITQIVTPNTTLAVAKFQGEVITKVFKKNPKGFVLIDIKTKSAVKWSKNRMSTTNRMTARQTSVCMRASLTTIMARFKVVAVVGNRELIALTDRVGEGRLYARLDPEGSSRVAAHWATTPASCDLHESLGYTVQPVTIIDTGKTRSERMAEIIAAAEAEVAG